MDQTGRARPAATHVPREPVINGTERRGVPFISGSSSKILSTSTRSFFFHFFFSCQMLTWVTVVEQKTKMSIDLKFVELTADVLEIFFIKSNLGKKMATFIDLPPDTPCSMCKHAFHVTRHPFP